MSKLGSLFVKVFCVALLLFVLLFSGGVFGASITFISPIIGEFSAVFLDRDTQWICFLCVGILFVAFGLSRVMDGHLVELHRTDSYAFFLLAGFCFINAARYASNYSSSLQAVTMLGGAAIGQGMGLWAGDRSRNSKTLTAHNMMAWLVYILIVQLALASAWQTSNRFYSYHRHVRWSGLWDNPNTLGLLMAAGIVLAFGVAIPISGFVFPLNGMARTTRPRIWRYAIYVLSLGRPQTVSTRITAMCVGPVFGIIQILLVCLWRQGSCLRLEWLFLSQVLFSH